MGTSRNLGYTVGENIKIFKSWAPVAHTYNLCYSGGSDQEDQGLKPVQANNSRDPISKKIHHKKGLVEWLKVLSSNPSTTKKILRDVL
jgi:hypothetical protein